MKRRALLLLAAAPILLCSLSHAEEAESEPFPQPYMDYGTEELDRDPPIVAGSGRIHVRYGDFEMLIEDGGVVLWVDPDGWRRLTRPSREDGGKEKPPPAEPPKGEGMIPGSAASILGPVIHELYAEGGVTLRRGREVVKAERLYYNFVGNRAVILEAEVHGQLETDWRGARIPLLLRAERIYQVVPDELKAGPAKLTTCLYGVPHVEMMVDNVTIKKEGDGYSFDASSTVLSVGPAPFLWLPYLYGATDVGVEPLKGGDAGISSKYGAFGELLFGGDIRFGKGKQERRWGEWEAQAVYRHRRGPGLGGLLEYAGSDHEGEVRGFYQYDRKSEDTVAEEEIPDRHRGWGRWRHKHRLDEDLLGGGLSGQGELAWVSDRNFLREYYPFVDKEDKRLENLAYVSWSGSGHAASITGRWRPVRFYDTTEYAPRAAYDLFATPLLADILGSGADLLVYGEAEAARLHRRYDSESAQEGARTNRFTGRGVAALPFSLGPIRLSPEAGAGVAGYSGDQREDRLDVFGGVRASLDLWRDFPDVSSDLLLLSGLRHVVDVSAGYVNRYRVTTPSSDLVVQDPADLLDEVEALDLRIRNRLQTKRDGAIVEWIDLELRGVFFPDEHEARPAPFDAREEWGQGVSSLLLPEEEKFRSIRRKGMGPLLADFRAQVRPNLFFVADAWYDFETRGFETFSEGVRYEARPDLAFFVGHRAIRNDSSVLTAWVDVRLTSRWAARLIEQYNFRQEGGLLSGLVVRRYLHDFVASVSLRRNEQENETSISFSLEPRFLFETRRTDSRDVMDFESMRWYP